MSNMNPGAPGMSFPDIPRNSDLDDYVEDEPVTADDDIASGDVVDELDRRAVLDGMPADEETLPDEDEYPRDSGT